MRVRFVPEREELVLPLDLWAALVAMASPEAPAVDHDVRQELAGAGLLGADGPHPALLPLLQAAADPLVTLHVQGGADDCVGWQDAGMAVLAVPAGEGAHAIRADASSMLPAMLAEVLDLGPRPAGEGEKRPWQVAIQWTAPDGGWRGRRCALVDDPASGWLHRRGDGDAGSDVPVTSTFVWRLLAGSLPTPDEVGLQPPAGS